MKAALIKLHLAVFLWGFTGVLGRAIELNEGLLVWYRLLLTLILLFIWMWWRKELQLPSKKIIFKLLGIGVIVAAHWVCFYGSIKCSNVSIALVCLSSAGFITALLEPLIVRRRIILIEILLGLIAIAGIYLIFHFDARYRTGIIVGVTSAALSVLFSVLNKKIIKEVEPKSMMFFELLGGFIALSLLMPLYLHVFPTTKIFPAISDWGWLLLLSWFCTIIAMDFSLQALQKISAFTQNLTLNLEPVYGIILAFIIYKEHEHLQKSFYFGFILIIAAVVLQIMRVLRRQN